MKLQVLKSLSLSLVLTCISLALTAQVNKTSFKGIVTDPMDLPVPGATVMILHADDSTLVQFAATDPKGAFLVKNVAKGDYLLNITFLGMAPIYQSITSGQTEEVDLGTLQMQEATTLLGEVKVTADFVPITMNKDTISYNADAFQTQPNAVVEDLLKKLPGIEVNPDGSIKAQGEDVRNVLVDGKEFFGSDPKLATRNLPAKALKKVKVYDKQSEMSEFTGVDDGIREKTIDLQLREEFKQGLFGTAQAGYGSDSRYNAKASLNRFSKTSQISLLGQFNNINDQGFSFSDRMNFSGGMRGMMGGGGGNRTIEISSSSNIPMSDGLSTGLVQTGAGGLNFNWQKSKKFNVRSSYFFNGVDKNLIQYSFRQNRSDNPFDTEENSNRNTDNRSHSFSLNSDIKPDSFNQVQVNARVGFGNGTGLNESLLRNVVSGTIENASLSQSDARSNNLSLNTGATFMRRLGNRGRNLAIGGTLSQGEQDQESIFEALNEFYITGDTEALNQLQFTTSKDTRLDAQFSFTEPLRKRRFLELSYNFNTLDADYDRRVYDVIPEGQNLNTMLSADYSSVFRYHRPGATFRYSGTVHNINAGLQYQVSELTGFVSQSETQIRQDYRHFLPRLTWRWDMGSGENLRFNYTTRINQPSITQLSPVTDNSDPLRLYVGNENLDAEYNHNLSINFHSFSQFSSTSFFTSLSGTITDDKIITSRNIDEQFREISSPINIDQETRVSLYASFGRPLKMIRSRVSLNTTFTLTNTQNVINTALLDLNRWSRSGGVTISNLNSEVLEYSLGGRWTFTDNYFKSNDVLNQNTLLHNYFVDVTLTLWKKWRIEGGYDYSLYTSNQFSENQSLPLMKVSISRFVMPADKGQIKFSIFDVLDENRGLSRSANINYLEEIRSNSIGRYAMLSFIYAIRGAKVEAGSGGFRHIERRR